MKTLVTISAPARFLASMSPHVFCNISISHENLSTKFTLIWFLPSMCSKMPFEIIKYRKILLTLVASVWFLPRVYPHIIVKMKIACLWERFVVMIARVSYIVIWYHFMLLTFIIKWESLIKITTCAYFFVLYWCLAQLTNIWCLAHNSRTVTI